MKRLLFQMIEESKAHKKPPHFCWRQYVYFLFLHQHTTVSLTTSKKLLHVKQCTQGKYFAIFIF